MKIRTLASGSSTYPREIAKVELLGTPRSLVFTRDSATLVVNVPEHRPNDYAYVFKITPKPTAA